MFTSWSAPRHNRVIASLLRTGCNMQADMNKIRSAKISNAKIRNAKYQIGQVVRHRLYPFRGVVFDIDPVFDNTDEWYEFDPGGRSSAQRSAVLSSVRRERRDRIRRVRFRAKSLARYERRAGAASASRGGLRQGRQRRLPSAFSDLALSERQAFVPRPSQHAREAPPGCYGVLPACGAGAACDWGVPCCCSSFLRASSARRCSSSCSFFCCSSNSFGSVGGPS